MSSRIPHFQSRAMTALRRNSPNLSGHAERLEQRDDGRLVRQSWSGGGRAVETGEDKHGSRTGKMAVGICVQRCRRDCRGARLEIATVIAEMQGSRLPLVIAEMQGSKMLWWL